MVVVTEVLVLEKVSKAHVHELFYLLVVKVNLLPEIVRVVVVGIDYMIALTGLLLIVKICLIIAFLKILVKFF